MSERKVVLSLCLIPLCGAALLLSASWRRADEHATGLAYSGIGLTLVGYAVLEWWRLRCGWSRSRVTSLLTIALFAAGGSTLLSIAATRHVA